MLTSFVTLYLYMLGNHNLCPKGFERHDDVCIARHVAPGGPCPPFTVYSDVLKKCIHYHYHYRDICQDGYRRENGLCVVERTGVNCPPYTLYSDVLGKCIHIHEHPAKDHDHDHENQPAKDHDHTQKEDKTHEDHTEEHHPHTEQSTQNHDSEGIHFHDHTYDHHPRNIQHDRDFFANSEFMKFW